MDRRDRAVLDHQHNSLALGIIEPRGLAWRFAVKQAVRTACVEPQYPIPDDLKPDPADLRCLRALRTVINRRKSQKPPGLRPILRLPRQATQLHRLEIHAQRYRNRHGEPPAFATLNQSSADLGILDESRFRGLGINLVGQGRDKALIPTRTAIIQKSNLLELHERQAQANYPAGG